MHGQHARLFVSTKSSATSRKASVLKAVDPLLVKCVFVCQLVRRMVFFRRHEAELKVDRERAIANRGSSVVSALVAHEALSTFPIFWVFFCVIVLFYQSALT